MFTIPPSDFSLIKNIAYNMALARRCFFIRTIETPDYPVADFLKTKGIYQNEISQFKTTLYEKVFYLSACFPFLCFIGNHCECTKCKISTAVNFSATRVLMELAKSVSREYKIIWLLSSVPWGKL